MTDFIDQVKLKGSTPSLTNDQIEKSLLVSAGGSGYTSAPSVAITGGDGSGATATASIEGSITGIPITNNGSGYTSASISFSGSGGAAATPIISNGQIIAIRIDNGGYYSSPPSVTMTGNGSGATAQATMSVSDITVTNHGSGYTSDPTVTISAPTGPEISRNTATVYAKRKTDGTVDVFLGTFPKGSSYLTFDDNIITPEKTADWLLFTTSEAPHSPLLATNGGVVMEKDLIVGGFVDSGQGALLLNYGLVGKPKLASPPCILLMKSDTPYPSGGTLPSNPENGQLFDHSGNKKIWNGQNWITDNAYTGNYDTLFLFKNDAVTPAHLDVGNLTTHGTIAINADIAPQLTIGSTTQTNAKILFVGANNASANLYIQSNGILESDSSLNIGGTLWANTLAIGSYGALAVNSNNQVTTKNNTLDDGYGIATVTGSNININPSSGAARINLQNNGSTKAYFSWDGTNTYLSGNGTCFVFVAPESATIIPYEPDTYYLGTWSFPWGWVYTQNLEYGALNQVFDDIDDLELIRNLKTITVDNQTYFDPSSINYLRDKHGYYDLGKINGWHLSVQKKLVAEIDALKQQVNALQTPLGH